MHLALDHRAGDDLPSRRPEAFSARRSLDGRGRNMAKKKALSSFPKLARQVLNDYRTFHPTLAASSGLHAYDGRLPHYTPSSVRRFAQTTRRHLESLDRFATRDGLSPNAKLELGVLRGMLLTELSDIEDRRRPWSLPTYSLYRMNIVNYLLRSYAPFDRRMRRREPAGGRS